MYNSIHLNTNTPQLLITVGRVLTNVKVITMATSKYTPDIPYGYCHCGCGQKTNIIKASNSRTGLVKGEPYKYIANHSGKTQVHSDLATLFWKKVAVAADDNQCWIWLGSCDSSGYGTQNVKHTTQSAHRISWRMAHGDIPENVYICHTCDNPKCVNPKHLWMGTSQDNALDREKKGRGNQAFGERAANTKITSADVIEIRNRYKTEHISMAKLSREYGIGETQIGRIIHYETWRHLK